MTPLQGPGGELQQLDASSVEVTQITAELRHLGLGLLNITAPECTVGYSGVACKQCMPKYYRLASTCAPCPKRAYLLIVAFVIAMGEWL